MQCRSLRAVLLLEVNRVLDALVIETVSVQRIALLLGRLSFGARKRRNVSLKPLGFFKFFDGSPVQLQDVVRWQLILILIIEEAELEGPAMLLDFEVHRSLR